MKCSTELEEAILTFENCVKAIEKEEQSLGCNVRLLLATQFFNHAYSALLLSEAGLVVNALSCERSALETLAVFRLVSLAPEYAKTYDTDDFPRPVEVRKRLEELGLADEVRHIRELYSWISNVLHVSRSSERWNSKWLSKDQGILLFGGSSDENNHREMLRFLPALLHWFVQPLNKESE